MTDNLAVKITADVVDLQVKFAVARAETNQLTAELNKLAQASAKGALDAEGAAHMREVADDLLHARKEAGELASQLEESGVSFSSFGHHAEEAHHHIATLAVEVKKLLAEFSEGNATGAGLTVLKLAQHLTGLGPAGLIAAGGVAALATGLGYLIIRAFEASSALDKIHIGAQFAGNMDLSREKLEAFADDMAKAADISHSQALKLTNALARIPGMTLPQMQALSAEMGVFVAESGKDADKVSESLDRMFSPKVSAGKFAELLSDSAQLTQAQLNAAEEADRSGDAHQIAAAKVQIFHDTLQRGFPVLAQHNAELTQSARFAGENALIEAGKLDEENAKRREQNRLIAQGIEQLKSTPQTPQQTLQVGVAAAKKENPVAEQIKEANTEIDKMSAALEVAKRTGDSFDVEKLNAGLAKARETLSGLQFGPVLERMRTQMEQTAATWDGTQSGLLVKQRQVAEQALAEVRKSLTGQATASKEYLAVQQEIARLDVQIRQASGQEIIAEARTRNAQLSGDMRFSGVQRLEQERTTWEQILTGERLTGSQRAEVRREIAQLAASIEKEQRAEELAIRRADADTDINIARMNVEEKKAILDEELAANRITAAQKLATLKTYTQEGFNLNLKALQGELDAVKQDPVAYDRVYNQIRELRARLNVDLAALDRQAAADARRAAQEQAKAWQTAINEIESAESTLLGDLLARRKTFAQSALTVAGQLVDREIQADVRAMTTRLLIKDKEEASKRAISEGGLLYHLIQQKRDTNSTVTGEAAKTGAVIAGNEARVTSTEVAAVQSKAAQNAVNRPTVMADAAKAFSGTYSALAGIPIVGPIIAPIAATAAYAVVAGYEGLASLEVGAWEVPGTMRATLHQGETVVPRDFASGLRATGSLDRAGGDTFGDMNIHNHFHSVMPTTDQIMAHFAKAVRNGHPAWRSARG